MISAVLTLGLDVEFRVFVYFLFFLLEASLFILSFCAFGVLSRLCFEFSVPVQTIACKDSCPYWPNICRAGRKTLLTHSDTVIQLGLTERFFRRSVLLEASYLHYVLPDKLDSAVTDRLRHAKTFALIIWSQPELINFRIILSPIACYTTSPGPVLYWLIISYQLYLSSHWLLYKINHSSHSDHVVAIKAR